MRRKGRRENEESIRREELKEGMKAREEQIKGIRRKGSKLSLGGRGRKYEENMSIGKGAKTEMRREGRK